MKIGNKQFAIYGKYKNVQSQTIFPVNIALLSYSKHHFFVKWQHHDLRKTFRVSLQPCIQDPCSRRDSFLPQCEMDQKKNRGLPTVTPLKSQSV